MSQVYHYYSIFGLRVRSDFELTHAFPMDTEDADVIIQRAKFAEELSNEMIMEASKGSGCIMHHSEQWSCMHYAELGAFEIKKGTTINYQLKLGCNENRISQILLCNCLGIIMAQRNLLAIHGSVTFMNGQAVIISGGSGSGKSTLTGELLLQGAELMADDTACVKKMGSKIYAEPGFPIRKLCNDAVERFHYEKEKLTYLPDGEREKYAISEIERYHNYCEPVKAMFIITPKEVKDVSINEITGNEKLRVVTNNLYNKMLISDIGFSPLMLHQCIEFCKYVSIYQLIRPVGEMTTKEQAEYINQVIQKE